MFSFCSESAEFQAGNAQLKFGSLSTAHGSLSIAHDRLTKEHARARDELASLQAQIITLRTEHEAATRTRIIAVEQSTADELRRQRAEHETEIMRAQLCDRRREWEEMKRVCDKALLESKLWRNRGEVLDQQIDKWKQKAQLEDHAKRTLETRCEEQRLALVEWEAKSKQMNEERVVMERRVEALRQMRFDAEEERTKVIRECEAKLDEVRDRYRAVVDQTDERHTLLTELKRQLADAKQVHAPCAEVTHSLQQKVDELESNVRSLKIEVESRTQQQMLAESKETHLTSQLRTETIRAEHAEAILRQHQDTHHEFIKGQEGITEKAAELSKSLIALRGTLRLSEQSGEDYRRALTALRRTHETCGVDLRTANERALSNSRLAKEQISNLKSEVTVALSVTRAACVNLWFGDVGCRAEAQTRWPIKRYVTHLYSTAVVEKCDERVAVFILM